MLGKTVEIIILEETLAPHLSPQTPDCFRAVVPKDAYDPNALEAMRGRLTQEQYEALSAIAGQDLLDVDAITESDLYLRYVLGEVPLELLHRLPERHIRCNPALAQYIADPAFPPVRCEGAFLKEAMDAEYVAAEEARVTRGWRRLQEIPALGLTIAEYPLDVGG